MFTGLSNLITLTKMENNEVSFWRIIISLSNESWRLRFKGTYLEMLHILSTGKLFRICTVSRIEKINSNNNSNNKKNENR